MNRQDQIWQRLTKAARQAEAAPAPDAPFGFATRMSSRWAGQTAPCLLSAWERLSGRVLAAGCGVLLLSIVGGIAFQPTPAPDVSSLPDQTIELVLAP